MKDKLPINSLEYMEHNVGYDSIDTEIFLKFRNLYNFWIRSSYQKEIVDCIEDQY